MPFKYYDLTEKLTLIGDLVESTLTDGRGMGYEIGVWRGKTSHYLMQRFPLLEYRGVDPYLSWEKYGVNQQAHLVNAGIAHKLWFTSDEEAESVYGVANDIFESFSNRAKLIRKKSLEVIHEIPDNSLDFVYIDGNHFYDEVLADIVAWMDKVRPRGILIGDDFNWNGNLNNVARAVHECFRFEYGVMADTWFWKKM